MKKPPIGTPPREASERRLAEEQAKRVPLPGEEKAEVSRLRAALDRARAALAPFAAVCPPDDMLDQEGDDPTPLSETPSSCALFVNELAAAKQALSELDALSGKEET